MTDYVSAVMRTAVIEQIYDGTFVGEVRVLPGVHAWGENEELCYWALRKDVEVAIAQAIRDRQPLPAVGGEEPPTPYPYDVAA
jgi:predicted RNase H-like HicB family nuclease